MEDWESHDQSVSPHHFCHHDNEWSPDINEEPDWMEHESGTDIKEKKAWLDDDAADEAGLGSERAELGAASEDDVYTQLAQKEQDLMLAAELGKALLEKNQELEEQVAKLTEDFHQKLEVLEQERHCLQSQLTQRQAEYDNTVRDLQDDVNNLHDQLRHHDDQTSAGQRRHVHDLRQLRQQNEALSEQLRQSVAQQQALSAEAGQLREQLTSRRSNFHQRVDDVDQLKDEAEYLRQRHQELEVQMRHVKEERDALATELENVHERLLAVEKQRLLQEEQLHHQQTELQELRDTNSMLRSQLQQLTSRCNGSGDSPTLFTELSHLNDLNISPPASFLQFNYGSTVNCLPTDMLDGDDDFEYDDDIFCDVITHSTPIPFDMGCHDNRTGSSLQDELMGQYDRMASPVADNPGVQGEGEEEEGRRDSDVTGDQLHQPMTPSKRPVTLTAELQDLLKDMYSDEEDDDRSSPKNRGRNSSGDHHPRDSNRHVTEMVLEQGHCDLLDAGGGGELVQEEREEDDDDDEEEESFRTLSRQSQQHANDMLQAQQSRIDKLERRVQELESRVQELQEERDKLQDKACGQVPVPHLLQQTRQERDNATTRVSDMERELSRLTGEVVTLNGQLMDTIRKKVMISQELDQWQVDLSEVLAVQMHRRMREQQKVEQAIGQLQKGAKPEVPVLKTKKKR